MKRTLSLFLCCIAFVSLSQEKQFDAAALTLQLSEVQVKISNIASKVESINSRLLSNPSEEVPSHIVDHLELLERNRIALERVKFSVQAALDNSTHAKSIIVVSKSQFENYSKDKQEKILANPEQFKIEEK